jgi:hypothetical protein
MGMVGKIQVREKRDKPLSHVQDRRSFADRDGFAPPVR